MKKLSSLLITAILLAACGASPTIVLPTAYVVRSSAAAPAVRIPTSLPIQTNTPEIAPTYTPAATPALGAPLDQYRAWMQEARAAHPYSESIELMWQVMLCESSGQADQVADSYHGLFQYLPSTWEGDWNPYRASQILDARAQIFATAKAWQDGNQHWWGCYSQ